MSVQDRIEVSGATALDAHQAETDGPQPVVVRRRGAIFLALAAGALLVAAAYSWRALDTGAPALWVVAAALAAVGAANLGAAVDAKVPLLLADATGVRARHGRCWRGLPWSGIDAVEVTPQNGRRSSGRINIRAGAGSSDVLTVSLGWATRLSAPDVAAALRDLAQGRTDVTVEEAGTTPGPEPAPDLPEAPNVEPDGAPTEQPDDAPGMDPDGTPTEPPDQIPEEPGVAPDEAPEPAVDPGPTAAQPRRPALSVLRAIRPALRAEVTKPATARQPATLGTLALAEPAPRPAEALPEIAHLRRADSGNVSLLVGGAGRRADEVGSAPPPAVAPYAADPVRPTAEPVVPVIGPQLAAARERLGMGVEDVALRTRIRAYVIDAVEVDDFAPCGGDFYARGHLRAIARVVGTDPEPLVRAYDERYATAPVNPRTVFEADRATGHGTIRATAGGPNWAALIAVVLALLLVWGVARLFSGGSDPPPPPAVSGAAPLGQLAPG